MNVFPALVTLRRTEGEEEEGEGEEGEEEEEEEEKEEEEEEDLTDLHAVHLGFEDGVVVFDAAPVPRPGGVGQVEAVLLQNIQSFVQSAHTLQDLGGWHE